jgi:hypothetical protein
MAEETERVAVKTYVPDYQRENWRDHADELDMSLSEFVRTMTQAGRRGFDLEPIATDDGTAEETGSPDANPRGDDLEDLVLDTLREEGSAPWATLVDAATEGLEDRLDETLGRLQEEGRIQHSGRAGGYTLSEAP